MIGGVHSQAAGAGDKIPPLQEPQSVLEALLTIFGENLGVRREENSAETDHVVLAHLYTSACYLDLTEGKREWMRGDIC